MAGCCSGVPGAAAPPEHQGGGWVQEEALITLSHCSGHYAALFSWKVQTAWTPLQLDSFSEGCNLEFREAKGTLQWALPITQDLLQPKAKALSCLLGHFW